MGDDCRDYRKSKPQQKLYKPGSGPLRRSTYGLDGNMDIYVSGKDSKTGGKGYYGSQNSVNEEGNRDNTMTDARQRKPEQLLYVPKSSDSHPDMDRQRRSDNSSQYSNRSGANRPDKNSYNNSGSGYSRGSSRRDRSYGNYHNKESGGNDVNFNRNHRQVSEPRARTPTKYGSELNQIDRNRDSRSMETSAWRSMLSSSGKPPSGRRNSAGYTSDSSRPHKYTINIENLPPRLRRKYLEEQGHHSFDNVDQIREDKYNNSSFHTNYDQNQYYNNSMWSQTLPSRGRGRIREADNFDKEKFMNSFKKNYEMQNSRRSTPSSSYTNLYEPNSIENTHSVETDRVTAYLQSQTYNFESAPKNGTSTTISEVSLSSKKQESEPHESDVQSHSSNNLLDMTNLDWSEEVEQNIKLDETPEMTMSASFSQNLKISSTTQEVKPPEQKESKRSRRRDKRSSSKGYRKERNRKDSVASNVSLQQEAPAKQRERERRDSHRSNRSSTIGNSRDDLDRWRSLRSYSREHSIEGKIVSQCNSRDPSANRDNDGFRIPSTTWTSTQKKNGPLHGRPASIERRRHSPAPSHATIEPALPEIEKPSGGRRRKRSGRKKGRNSENAPPPTPVPAVVPVQHNAPATTNWRAEILQSKQAQEKPHSHDAPRRNRLNSNVSDKSLSDLSTSQPGVLVLPQTATTQVHRDQGKGASVESSQKVLFDHHNPAKPIVVQTSPSRVDTRLERGMSQTNARGVLGESSDAARADRHRSLLQQVDRADAILQTGMITRSAVSLAASYNEDVGETRRFLQAALQRLLMSDLKYCQADNIEHHFWKILYYNIIEFLRKSLTTVSGEDKSKIVKLIITIIEEGNTYFENLVQMLEKSYKFNTDDYLNDNHVLPPKGLGYVGLALISVQKLYLFLGDLARYKEQVNETNNFAKSKLWYTKAQQINPKNGRPYNQLAILAIYARRKLDAVYYYMRSLMSSNPFMSAKESLLSLFEENRKKYEAAERKRRAALELSKPVEMPESSSQTSDSQTRHREKWIRPGGVQSPTHHSDDDHFASMTSVELNKNFITSYLHVHGKLVTKIGMESFHECASAMLRQFRALLHRQPLPTPAARLLQLTALNMFAVETSAHKNDITGERSAWLNCALSVGLLMFGALIERCCALLPEPPHSQQHSDALLLLPAIKVWSDWMLCHSSVWNPPPSFSNFDIGSDNNPWDWLAKLMNILEELDEKSIEVEFEAKEGYNLVRLSEDVSLAGFTPLMLMDPAYGWADHTVPRQTAEHLLRTRKLLFFGTEYLVGVEPPVLSLEYPPDAPPRYVSAVQNKESLHVPLQHWSEDSEDDDSTKSPTSGPASLTDVPDGADAATRRLLRRKEQLEKRKATLERRQQKMQEILRSNSMEVEVRPRWLVPDTNCFIDHLPLLQAVAATPEQPYLLAVPLVVVTELEGLSRCERVGGHARAALAWVKTAGAGVRFATSQGTLLTTRAFTAEKHAPATNDDRVLFTASNLHANISSEPDETNKSSVPHRVCSVVLLTDDRNLRVKALAVELPARDLPSFVQWAGITIVAAEKPADAN